MPTNNNLAEAVRSSLITHNTETGHAWTFGTNWTNEGKEFETYVNKYLFPKLNETLIIESILGNRFNWLAKETDFIGQYSEECCGEHLLCTSNCHLERPYPDQHRCTCMH